MKVVDNLVGIGRSNSDRKMANEKFYFELSLNLSWEDMSMNETVDGKLTLGIADFDLSADVFSDPGC